jgi:hypothetical protein
MQEIHRIDLPGGDGAAVVAGGGEVAGAMVAP